MWQAAPAEPAEEVALEMLTDADLARRVHENVVDMFCAAAASMDGGHVVRLPGVAAAGSPLPLLLFNQVLVEDADLPPDMVTASLKAGVASFVERGKRFALTLRGGFDDAFLPIVSELGLASVTEGPWMPGMAVHPLPAPGSQPTPAGHEIRVISEAADLDDHARVISEGFGMPLEWVTAFVTPALLAWPGLTLYTGYLDGEAVTSGVGFVVGRTMGVYNIATVEGARRRGLGAAMTQRIVDDGAAAGCDVAILQASEMGLPVYERLGFRTVSEYFGYAPPKA